MPLKVTIPTVLRNLTENKEMIELDAKGSDIKEIIGKLDQRYPGFQARLCGENQELRRFINIYVDGEDIRFLKHLSTPVSDGSEVSIVLAVAGG